MSSRYFDDVKQTMPAPGGEATIFNVQRLSGMGYDVEALPFSVKVLLENALRHSERRDAAEAVERLAEWPKSVGHEMPFMPYRVLLQDYTGVPLIVDLAAMRDAAKRSGLDPKTVNSKIPVDLVIDHSLQVDSWSTGMAFDLNLVKEYERNSERYALLKWAQSSFKGLRVFPPDKGICHQVNLEYLAKVVVLDASSGSLLAYPDTLVGTDSHTTMVNGLGVLGWGVGGIEAEAVMLGEPYPMPIPKVVGVKLVGRMREGVTPTDVVLTVTEQLRQKNVVGQFVEYFGEGYRELSVPDRATLGNMSPEYGATVGFSPIDDSTLSYLLATGRDPSHVEFVRQYARMAGFFAGGAETKYSEVLVIDLDRVEPCIAGPRNPEERRALRAVPEFARRLLDKPSSQVAITDKGVVQPSPAGSVLLATGTGEKGAGRHHLIDGAVVIAAITSCTNTSNPTVMVGAGLLAKRAVERGLTPKPWVKRSFAPGSTVVTDYLQNSGLLPYLEALGFNLVGYACTTCIGNSGPLAPEIEKEIIDRNLYAVAALSGNRNFDGRIHPLAKGAFLMSPILVVAYALVGRIDFDFYNTPIGTDKDGSLVFLRDIWPSLAEIKETVQSSLSPELYRKRYGDAAKGDPTWDSLASYDDEVFHWQTDSTYIKLPPWFEKGESVSVKKDIAGARVLAVLGDKVTTDHISPAGSIPVDTPAGAYLLAHGVDMIHFSSYGSRRGNHDLMVRGGFANTKLKNRLAAGKDGGFTKHLPTGAVMSIFEASSRYAKDGTPLIVLAGKQYGAGSSRDWAAKAPKLLGVKAVIAEDYERIHRGNLIAMGVLPLQYRQGENAATLGLTGEEVFDITGIGSVTSPNELVDVSAKSGGGERRFKALLRIDNETEMKYVEHGGVLPYVFSRLRPV